MSSELVFWQQGTSETFDPATVYTRPMDGLLRVEGLNEIAVDDFLDELSARFSGATREPNGTGEWFVWARPDQKAVLEVTWSSQHVRADCRGMSNEEMNRVMDVAIGLRYPLFDPQTGERFAYDL